MTSKVDGDFGRDIESLAPSGMLVGHRLISAGDEDALLEDEKASIASSVTAARRASAAARIVARGLLAQLGYSSVTLPKTASGAPLWPAGIVGSLTHDDQAAVATVGLKSDFAAIGVDVEPAVPLSSDMLPLVAKPDELGQIAGDPLGGKLLFAVKEAVYKAVYPLDGTFLEFQDIAVDLAALTATTRTGRVLALRYCVSSHVLALAFSHKAPRA